MAHRENKLSRNGSTRVGWRDVLRAVQDTQTRSGVCMVMRRAGFLVDSFETKTEARQIVCEALTRAEDQAELAGRGRRERLAMRDVRRRLELELWP